MLTFTFWVSFRHIFTSMINTQKGEACCSDYVFLLGSILNADNSSTDSPLLLAMGFLILKGIMQRTPLIHPPFWFMAVLNSRQCGSLTCSRGISLLGWPIWRRAAGKIVIQVLIHIVRSVCFVIFLLTGLITYYRRHSGTDWPWPFALMEVADVRVHSDAGCRQQ